MAENESQEEVHPMEKFLDNDFLLLAFHLGVTMLSYVVWGMIEIMSVPTLGS